MQNQSLANRILSFFSFHIIIILILLLSNSLNITQTLKQDNQMITEVSGSATDRQIQSIREIVGWDVLITSQEQWGSNSFDVYSENSYAQSFHTDVECNLSKVCFYGRKRGNPFGTVTVKIMADDEGKPSGIILENGTITISITTLAQWYEAIVNPTIFLEANITYWIVLEADLNFNQRFQWFYYDIDDIYPDGNTASDTGSGWENLFQSNPFTDCTFKLYEKVTSDNVLPTCEIIIPLDGQVVDKTTQIEVNATDDICIAHVNFFIDNQLVYIDNNAPYIYSWDTTSIIYGVCIISAIAYDIANNTANSIPITVTVNQTATPLKSTQRYAVIVGVSDYKVADDLSYCDEDVTDWYNYLREVFYIQSNQVWILGDNHPENYPKYDGLATEAETKAKLSQMISLADSDDEIFFLTSGHGTGDGNGNSILCMWDYGSGEGSEDGALRDYELANIFSSAKAKNVFIFIDHCYAGGFIPELIGLSNNAQIFCTTTCSESGSGYDDSSVMNGLWTYYFLEYGLVNYFGSEPGVSMEDVFNYASKIYPAQPPDVDAPMIFDGNSSTDFSFEHPDNVDSDGDGVSDGAEINIFGTDPGLDDFPPVIMLNNIVNNTIHEAGTIIGFNIQDPNGLSQVLYHWDNEDNNKTLTAPYEIILILGDGLHVLYVYAKDNENNWAYERFIFTTNGGAVPEYPILLIKVFLVFILNFLMVYYVIHKNKKRV